MIQKTNDIVKRMLVEYPFARNNDRYLITKVYEFLGVDVTDSFASVLKHNDLPTFETITRCRRKAQEENENLRPNEQVDFMRSEEECKFRAWALGEYDG